MNGPWTHRTLATAVLGFAVAFLYQFATVLQSLQDYEQLWNSPKIGGDVVMGLIYGLVALGAALGLNVRRMIGVEK